MTNNNLDNETYNQQLLWKYLTFQLIKDKNYPKDKAKELALQIIKNSDNLWGYHGLVWELGSKNLAFFNLYFLQNIFHNENSAEIAPIHYELWNEVQNMILKKTHERQAYILPRGTGKSSFITLSAAIWTSAYEYKHYTLICSAIGDTANKFINNIKLALDGNNYIEKAFGKLYDPKNYTSNQEIIVLANNTCIQSISASSTMRGKNYGTLRVELALLDDYQTDEETSTPEQREKKWKKFNDDVAHAMQKGNSTIIAVGTVQHDECFYSRLLNSPIWKSRNEQGVLVDNVDELFNSGLWAKFKEILFDKSNSNRLDYAKEFYLQNKDQMQYPMLWQSYWDCYEYALLYYGNPVSFKQEVQGITKGIGEKWFKTIVTETPEEIESHNFEKTMLLVDPAGTRNKNNKAKDYYCFIVGSISDRGIKYVRKGELFKEYKNRYFEYEDYINHVIELLKQYTDITHVWIEKNTYMMADVLKLQELVNKDDVLRYRDIEWISKHETGNKDDKIRSITGDINLGQIVFNEEDQKFIEQVAEFSGTKYVKHDDGPDLTATFGKYINEIEVVEEAEILDINRLYRR